MKQLSARPSLKRSRRHCLRRTLTGLNTTTFTASGRADTLTIVCRDQFVDPTVKVILKVAHTGEIGDGRIFVSEMIDTWSIRTGENGDTVLRDKK